MALISLCVIAAVFGFIQANVDKVLQLNERVSYPKLNHDEDKAPKIILAHGFEEGKKLNIKATKEGIKAQFKIKLLDIDERFAFLLEVDMNEQLINIKGSRIINSIEGWYLTYAPLASNATFNLEITREDVFYTRVYLEHEWIFTVLYLRHHNMSAVRTVIYGTAGENIEVSYCSTMAIECGSASGATFVSHNDSGVTTKTIIEATTTTKTTTMAALRKGNEKSKCELDWKRVNNSELGRKRLPCRFDRNDSLILIGKVKNQTMQHNGFGVNLRNSADQQLLRVFIQMNPKSAKLVSLDQPNKNESYSGSLSFDLGTGNDLVLEIQIEFNFYKVKINGTLVGSVLFNAYRGFPHFVEVDGDIDITDLHFRGKGV